MTASVLSGRGLSSSLLTIKQELAEERHEFAVGIQRQHVRNVLIRTHNDQCAVFTVDAAEVKNIRAVLQIGAEGFFVVDQPETALARQQYGGQFIDPEFTMAWKMARTSMTLSISAPAGVKRRTGESGESARNWASLRSR